ncbi:MAG: hypothetical protein IJS61_07275 [Firmicutes bacterium]|nr:hypothetical protein [Bacillota bacterium]
MTKFLKFIQGFFARDIGWKILSLIGAVVIWFLVMNTVNPVETANFSTSVSLINAVEFAEKGYVVVDTEKYKNQKVNIRVSATRPALDELSKGENKSRISANADLLNIDINKDDVFPKTYSVLISPKLPINMYGYSYDVNSYYPTYVSVEVDKIESKELPLKVNYTGTPKNGFVAGTPYSDTQSVLVTGASARLPLIDKVEAIIDVSGEDENIIKKCSLHAYGSSGEELTDFGFGVESVDVHINIYKQGTVSLEKPEIKNLPSYMSVENITFTPSEIKVIGEREKVDNLKSVKIPDADLSSVTGNTVITCDLADVLKEQGVSAESGRSTQVEVTVNVNKNFTIPSKDVDIIGAKDGDTARFIQENIKFRIGGDNDITSISQISASVDISGQTPGNTSVPLIIKDTAGEEISNDTSVNLVISSPDAPGPKPVEPPSEPPYEEGNQGEENTQTTTEKSDE